MKLTPLIVIAALAAASSAYAQGGGGMTPEMQAARDAMTKACAADAKTLCDGKEKRELMMCLNENAGKLSAPCTAAMSKMPARPARPQ